MVDRLTERINIALAGGGAAVPSFVLTCTTAGAATLTLQSLGVKTGKTVTVDWGDGSSNAYTGDATRTHNYAGAGTWTVKMTQREDIYKLFLIDAKLSGTINAANPMPTGLTYLYLDTLTGLAYSVSAAAPMPTGLTYLYLSNLTSLTWTVSATAPMPTGLTSLYLDTLTGLTWTVSATAPMPTGLTYIYLAALTSLTWTVSATAPMPTGLTSLNLATLTGLTWTVSATAPMPTGLTSLHLEILTGLTWTINVTTPLPTNLVTLTVKSANGVTLAAWNGNAIRTIQWESSLSQAAVDNILTLLWGNKANFTYATPTLDLLGGSNAAPSGTYQTVCPPTSGKEYKYDLVNGICTAAGAEWTVTTA